VTVSPPPLPSGSPISDFAFEGFTTNQLQVVLWFEGYEPSAKDVVQLAASKWAHTLDGEPVLLPNAAGLPPELPRAIVPSADGHWKMQLSARRLELVWDQLLDRSVVAPADFQGVVESCVLPFFEVDPKLRVTRIAFIVRRHLVTENPAETLATYFVRDGLRGASGPLNRPEGFELHAHKRYRPKSLPEINSWVRWRTASLTNGLVPVIAVTQDLNTPESRELSYSAGETRSFFRDATTEADDILKLYLSQAPAK